MIYLLMLALSLVLMLPLLTLLARAPALRERRETSLALHRAQLDELARDLTLGRLAQSEYEGARLEIERRLLAADALAETTTGGHGAKFLLIATSCLIPIMAFMLYLPGATPTIPSEPHAAWAAAQAQSQAQASAMIAALRTHLATLDPNSPQASEGQAYLAEALAEQAGQLTPEAIALFKQSITNAPAGASWRNLDEQRLVEAAASP